MFLQYMENVGRTTGGLAIKAGGSTVVKTVSTVLFTINGNMYTKSAADLAALTGVTVADLYTTIVTVYLDIAGTATYGVGTAQLTANLATGALADFQYADRNNASKTIIGFLIIKNATGAVFTGGATALSAAGITVTYINMANANLAV